MQGLPPFAGGFSQAGYSNMLLATTSTSVGGDGPPGVGRDGMLTIFFLSHPEFGETGRWNRVFLLYFQSYVKTFQWTVCHATSVKRMITTVLDNLQASGFAVEIRVVRAAVVAGKVLVKRGPLRGSLLPGAIPAVTPGAVPKKVPDRSGCLLS